MGVGPSHGPEEPQQLFGRRTAHESTLAEHGDALGDGLDVGDDMGGEDDGAPVTELIQIVPTVEDAMKVFAARHKARPKQPA